MPDYVTDMLHVHEQNLRLQYNNIRVLFEE